MSALRNVSRVQVAGPLSQDQSGRLGELFARHHGDLVRYTVRRLALSRSYSEAASLAEDLVQDLWANVARYNRDKLLGETWDGEHVRPILFHQAKCEISKFFRRMSSGERSVDWRDDAVCNILCPLMPQGCMAASQELPPVLSAMVDKLPEQEREALRMRLDGVNAVRMGEWLGCGESQADSLARTAVLLLQIEHPELSGPPVAQESLSAPERAALALVAVERREAVLRLEELPRRALLLLTGGTPSEQVAAELGMPRRAMDSMTRCLAALRRAGIWPSSNRPYPGCRAADAPSRGQIVDVLRQEASAMPAGQRLPSRRALADRFKTGSSILDEAFAALVDEGLIERRRGSGTYATGAALRLAVAA